MGAEGQSEFDQVLLVTLRYEGGYANNPADPGGATMRGVTQAVYDGWRIRNKLPRRPVRSIDAAELRSIYRAQYWDVIHGDDLPPGIDLAVFDYAVHSGPRRAAKSLQAALGVKVDGVIGNVTLAAAHEAAERDEDGLVIKRIVEERTRFLRGLRTWSTFGKGWGKRMDDVGRDCARLERLHNAAVRRTVPSAAIPDTAPVAYQPDAPGKVTPSLGTAVPLLGAGGLATTASSIYGAAKTWALGIWSAEVAAYVAMGGVALVAAWIIHRVRRGEDLADALKTLGVS